MAGSYNHLLDEQGRFHMDLIENLGDAHEALEECFGMIQVLTGGDTAAIEQARLNYRDGLRGTVAPDAQWDAGTDYSPRTGA
jgi:hypothetical protein